jgi:hypothetical protein
LIPVAHTKQKAVHSIRVASPAYRTDLTLPVKRRVRWSFHHHENKLNAVVILDRESKPNGKR